jgi:hypothetical protein
MQLVQLAGTVVNIACSSSSLSKSFFYQGKETQFEIRKTEISWNFPQKGAKTESDLKGKSHV